MKYKLTAVILIDEGMGFDTPQDVKNAIVDAIQDAIASGLSVWSVKLTEVPEDV